MTRRLGLVALLCLGSIVATETPTPACPSDSLLHICAGSESLDPAPAQPRALPSASELIATVGVADRDFDIPTQAPAPPDLGMPWIWQLLKTSVYERLPSYESSEDDYEIVFAPVIVDSPYDTVPGVGIEGDF